MRRFILSVLVLSWLIGTASADGSRPNVLLLIGDNWGWPHAGILGDQLAETPTFDRIAREGMLFENVFCPVPSCSPTRSSILTGRAAHQLEEAASLWSDFPKKHRVFTDELMGAGYDVGFMGKGWAPGRYKEHGWKTNPVGPEHPSFDAFIASRDASKPFFFWVGNVDTSLHRWKDLQTDWPAEKIAKVVVPPELPDTPEVRKSLLAYYHGVAEMDHAFGDVVKKLDDEKLLENTIIIHSSDNGWQMPRGLAHCYDTGCRVPMAIRWADKIASGSRTDDFISLTDLAPTILELAGVPVPREMTGRSFVEVMLGHSSDVVRDHVFLERERHANVRVGNQSYPMRCIRTREHLLIWNLRPDRWPAGDPELWWAVGPYGDVDGSVTKEVVMAGHGYFHELNLGKRPEFELYDLVADPHQLTNRAGDSAYRTVQSDLHQKIKDWMKTTGDPRTDASCDVWDTYPYHGGKFKERQTKASSQSRTKAK